MNIKKMTAFASVAICAAVAFGDGIESSNIAGENYSFFIFPNKTRVFR